MAASPEGLVYILPGKRRGKMFSSGAKANLCSQLMSELKLRRPTARKGAGHGRRLLHKSEARLPVTVIECGIGIYFR
jgi:hypothetical protein